MLILARRKYGMRVADVFFHDGESGLPGADVIFHFQAARPRGRSREVHTLLLDLGSSEAELFAACARNNRYKIARARDRDGLEFHMISEPTVRDAAAFLAFYDRFARGMGLAGVSQHKARYLESLRAAGGLWISRVRGPEGDDLCYHSYIVDDARARLFHSASHFRAEQSSARRSLIGRANRYLHWRDLLSFQELGRSVYDLGGLTPHSTAHRNIDEFKRSFGGRVVTEHNGVEGRTLPGRFAARLVDRRQRG